MATETEGHHQVDGIKLYTKTWTPTGPIHAKLIFIHGYSDHVNRYGEFFTHLATHGIQVLGFDQRGWGRSVHCAREKGLTGPTSVVLADMASFVRAQLVADGSTAATTGTTTIATGSSHPDAKTSHAPVFMMGHSMGGAETICFASADEYTELTEQIHGWLLEAPFIRWPVGKAPPRLKEVVGRFAARLLPGFQLHERLPANELTRDPAVAADMEADALMHNTGTLEGLAGMLARAEDVDHGRVRLRPSVQRLWVGHGTRDYGTGYEGTKVWFETRLEGVQDRTFKTYDDAYHALHCDREDTRREFFADVTEWILRRCERDGPTGQKEADGKTESKL